ncbi:unnamed protein product, partial [Durusdinium trenchii]
SPRGSRFPTQQTTCSRGEPMVFRASSQTLRDLLLGKKDKPSAAKRSATPRRDGLSSHAADAVPRGFRVVLPAGCRGGQVLRVQSPEGMQVDVQVPEGTAPGQAMWVQLPDVPASSQNPDSPAAAE